MDIIKRNLFEVIFIISDYDVQNHKDSSIRTARYFFLYVIDAGQVFGALAFSDFKWNDSIVTFMNQLDIIQLALLTVIAFFSWCSSRHHVSN